MNKQHRGLGERPHRFLMVLLAYRLIPAFIAVVSPFTGTSAALSHLRAPSVASFLLPIRPHVRPPGAGRPVRGRAVMAGKQSDVRVRELGVEEGERVSEEAVMAWDRVLAHTKGQILSRFPSVGTSGTLPAVMDMSRTAALYGDIAYDYGWRVFMEQGGRQVKQLQDNFEDDCQFVVRVTGSLNTKRVQRVISPFMKDGSGDAGMALPCLLVDSIDTLAAIDGVLAGKEASLPWRPRRVSASRARFLGKKRPASLPHPATRGSGGFEDLAGEQEVEKDDTEGGGQLGRVMLELTRLDADGMALVEQAVERGQNLEVVGVALSEAPSVESVKQLLDTVGPSARILLPSSVLSDDGFTEQAAKEGLADNLTWLLSMDSDEVISLSSSLPAALPYLLRDDGDTDLDDQLDDEEEREEEPAEAAAKSQREGYPEEFSDEDIKLDLERLSSGIVGDDTSELNEEQYEALLSLLEKGGGGVDDIDELEKGLDEIEAEMGDDEEQPMDFSRWIEGDDEFVDVEDRPDIPPLSSPSASPSPAPADTSLPRRPPRIRDAARARAADEKSYEEEDDNIDEEGESSPRDDDDSDDEAEAVSDRFQQMMAGDLERLFGEDGQMTKDFGNTVHFHVTEGMSEDDIEDMLSRQPSEAPPAAPARANRQQPRGDDVGGAGGEGPMRRRPKRTKPP
ncbi:unnamed protein product [Vitrella brassicaformis CCMP3155]|uniref:Uncharacterized protein n=2 Tax=Vitrella brassicaformis TaxID=1169539 RepID=A0A0G4EM00_VITBC|nr:unnamed protein product [Vitrella brassicaformis CCMP3155]|eukprot:CEL97863.1 unnamed protein product [Vitrella brassicaformis CCMP3155]